jgi:hippurate hydrolase
MSTTISNPATAATLQESIRADMPMLLALYRDIHANPELSMQEVRTPALLAPQIRKLGFDVTEHVGKTGIVAVMKNGPGPVLLLRADMDALPVKEQTGLPFASKVIGKLPDGTDTPVMHACGHDTHIATWLGTARRLAAMKDQWSGTLVMILQPGEERVIGAQAMLDDGLFTRFPKPDYLVAFHDSASLPAGVIGVTNGFALANVDTVNIDVKGIGGHGAYPQNTKDPIVLASRIVMALQTLVSRENDPQQPAVVTVGSFHAGTKSNIIGDDAKLALTVRSYTPETRKLLLDGIRRIVRGEGDRRGHARRQDADGRNRTAVGRCDLQYAGAVGTSAAAVRVSLR